MSLKEIHLIFKAIDLYLYGLLVDFSCRSLDRLTDSLMLPLDDKRVIKAARLAENRLIRWKRREISYLQLLHHVRI